MARVQGYQENNLFRDGSPPIILIAPSGDSCIFRTVTKAPQVLSRRVQCLPCTTLPGQTTTGRWPSVQLLSLIFLRYFTFFCVLSSHLFCRLCAPFDALHISVALHLSVIIALSDGSARVTQEGVDTDKVGHFPFCLYSLLPHLVPPTVLASNKIMSHCVSLNQQYILEWFGCKSIVRRFLSSQENRPTFDLILV